jgi:hypothetical protein
VANLTTLNTILLTVWAGCELLWLAFLNRAGESKSMVVGHRWDRQDEIRMLAQLRAINEGLLRTARK